MSVELENAYKDELHRALEKCQFIEETLKMCLLSAIEIAQIQVLPYFPLKYKVEDISKLPLGLLVKAFAKIKNQWGQTPLILIINKLMEINGVRLECYKLMNKPNLNCSPWRIQRVNQLMNLLSCSATIILAGSATTILTG